MKVLVGPTGLTFIPLHALTQYNLRRLLFCVFVIYKIGKIFFSYYNSLTFLFLTYNTKNEIIKLKIMTQNKKKAQTCLSFCVIKCEMYVTISSTSERGICIFDGSPHVICTTIVLKTKSGNCCSLMQPTPSPSKLCHIKSIELLLNASKKRISFFKST